MSDTGWRLLSERLGAVPDAHWREDIPAALEKPLREWLHDMLFHGELVPRGIGVPSPRPRGGHPWWVLMADRLRLRLNVAIDLELPDLPQFFAYDLPVGMLADVLDLVLELMPATVKATWDVGDARVELQRLLDDARSPLRLAADGRGLERRADVMAEAALGSALASVQAAPHVGSAGAHLRMAWECVHALRPDPGKAYSEAIKAVEASAHAVLTVEMRNPRMATLGSMIRALEKNQQEFALAIMGPGGHSDAGPLLECLSLLWRGQTSRHGSSRPTRPETLQEATMAVHLAVMFVQWFTSGAVWKQ